MTTRPSATTHAWALRPLFVVTPISINEWNPVRSSIAWSAIACVRHVAAGRCAPAIRTAQAARSILAWGTPKAANDAVRRAARVPSTVNARRVAPTVMNACTRSRRSSRVTSLSRWNRDLSLRMRLPCPRCFHRLLRLCAPPSVPGLGSYCHRLYRLRLGGDRFPSRPRMDDAASIHDVDQVRLLRRGQAVRDEGTRAAGCRPAEPPEQSDSDHGSRALVRSSSATIRDSRTRKSAVVIARGSDRETLLMSTPSSSIVPDSGS